MAKQESNVEIIRFRAWLEIGADPDTPETETPGQIFPITSCVITASLNSIPVATVTIATGIRVYDGKISPIHDKIGEILRNPKEWPWARVFFKNLQTNETTVIFEGFAESSGHSYSFSSTEIPLNIRHWAYALDASPSINNLINPSSAEIYTHLLYFRSLPLGAGTDALADRPASLTFNDAIAAYFAGGISAFEEDIIQHGLLEQLKSMLVLSDFYSPTGVSSRIPEENLKYDLALDAKTIIEKRLKTGDTNLAQLGPDQFPILKVQPLSAAGSLGPRMFNTLMATDNASLQMNSLWAAMNQFVTRFGVMIVPRVHELRFIPKWFMPKTNSVKIANGVISVDGTWEHARPVGGVLVIPTSAGNKAVSSIATPGAGTYELDSEMVGSLSGVYVPKGKSPGTILVRQRADWAGEVIDPNYFEIPPTLLQQEADKLTTTLPQKDELPAEKEADNSLFYDRLAEEAYWDEVLKGRRADLICPIRFDICPGSTVCVKTSGDVRADIIKRDQLATSYTGFVISMRLAFDTITAAASAQYTLTHVRDSKLQADLMEHHPFYQCGSFSDATWTRKRFKTINGSE